jgi:histidinol-phosphate phosphatase family protein
MGNTAKSLIDKSFLFTDRDGVINKHLENDYVKTTGDFEFLPGAIEAFSYLVRHFKRIIVVTNQRGIGKELFTETDLSNIHDYMNHAIAQQGGHIDAIYYCTALEESNPDRKPNSGMALKARADFPEIDFAQSIMLGDSKSDIEFGNRLGMTTVLILPNARTKTYHQDFSFNSIKEFASFLEMMYFCYLEA